jgi:hypothetical protein
VEAIARRLPMKRDSGFKSFLGAYPPVPGETRPVDGVSLAETIEERFGIAVPDVLQLFWLRVGAGVFGRGELYIFGGAASGLAGPEAVEWNAAPWWRSINPAPADGGPFFFAQTPFGDQLGFRWHEGVALPELLTPDTMEVFVLGRDVEELLHELLDTPGALCDQERLYRARQQCPVVPPGHHLVPDESPLLGGKDDSFHVEPPEAHIERAIAAWKKSQR